MGIVKHFKEYVKSKFNRLDDWVTKHASPVPKTVDDAWNFVKNNVQRLRSKKSLVPEPELEPNQEEHHNFEIHETEVALDGTATRYAISGREGYDSQML